MRPFSICTSFSDSLRNDERIDGREEEYRRWVSTKADAKGAGHDGVEVDSWTTSV